MVGLDNKTKIVVISGPTATGKSALALHLCKTLNGELVGADSMQIYEGLVVGTAAITEQEAQGTVQHLVGHVSPDTTYSVANYVEDAKNAIADIAKRGKVPVICGGTGLYITSLIEGISFIQQPANEDLRKKLWEQYNEQGGDYMLQKLAQLDPEYATQQHSSNIKRVLRGIEINELTGLTMAQNKARSKPTSPPYNVLGFCLNFEQRTQLYAYIEQRVDNMLQQGLLSEAEDVYLHKDAYITAAQAIGYKEFFPYFEQQAPLEDCINLLKQSTRRYAKRQITWFKKIPQLQWKDAQEKELWSNVTEEVENFLCK